MVARLLHPHTFRSLAQLRVFIGAHLDACDFAQSAAVHTRPDAYARQQQ